MKRYLSLPVLSLLVCVAVADSDPAAVASFGGAVAIGDGEFFVAEPTGFHDPGTVHLYRRGINGTWVHHAALRASDARVHDGFGSALALSPQGTLLVASAEHKIYVFERDPETGTWQETALLAAGEGRIADVAIEGATVLVGAPQEDAVYVFERTDADGDWTQTAKLEGGDSFGSAVALCGGRAFVGIPAAQEVHVWHTVAGTWSEDTVLSGTDPMFGAAIDVTEGNAVFIGAPAANGFTGVVHVYHLDAEAAGWEMAATLVPSSGDERDLFGASLSATDRSVWVGAPGTNAYAGSVWRFERSSDGDGWGAGVQWANDEVIPRSRLGNTLAATDELAVVGAAGSAYGEGSAVVLERSGDVWNEVSVLFNEREGMDPILGDGLNCEEGHAGGFKCGDVDLVSFIPLSDLGVARGVRLSDVWGWTDPETDREYGLVGHLEATVFVDLTDPSRPVFLGELPRTKGSPGSTWRDIKVYRDHAFVVADGAGAHGMQVFDLTRLRDVADPPTMFEPTAHYDGIASAHNVVINEETGFAFAVGSSAGGETCGGGLHMIDIREPTKPTFAGCFADETTGRRKTGYSHDAQCVTYHGPDTAHRGREICFGSNETAISIADVTDKTGPVTVGSGTYPDFGYVHQGWLSDDHAYFFQNDELDELTGKVDRTRTLVWDVRDLEDPVLVNEFFGPTSATDHNLYISGDLMYQTNNSSGLRIVDITDPTNPEEVGFFDTTPYGTDDAGFNGTWSSYPYFKSGMIVVTSRREGLFVVKRRSVDI